MKVNPIGIQSYQQVVGGRQQALQTEAQERSESQAVSISPKSKIESSQVAVKAPSGTYAKYLTENEKKALDLLFGRFAHNARLNGVETAESNAANDALHVGSVIDVKV